MIARCRWVKETIRVEDTLTRLPPGVRQMMSRCSSAVGEVQRPFVVLEVGDREQHRLVVDVELDRLVVGDIDDGLPDPGESERLLGVPDRPGLVEPVDEGAVRVGLPALLHVAAKAQVSVAHREQASRSPRDHHCRTRPRSGPTRRSETDCDPAGPRTSIGPSPLKAIMTGQFRQVGHHQVGPGLGQPISPDPAIDPDDQTEAAGPARLHAGQGVLEDHGALDRTPRVARRRTRRCPAPVCREVPARRPRCRRRRPRTAGRAQTPPAPAGRCGRRRPPRP